MQPDSARTVPPGLSIASFRRRITLWFNKHGRSYPWRETREPFQVLVAELMLRRTKADQVKPVYDRLFSEFPDVVSLAAAETSRIDEILYPLGLKWRTPAFVGVAQELVQKYGGKVPGTREELTTLPGVGDYVAGAVLSFAYRKTEWIVDANIVRLFRRYFGLTTSKEGRRDRHVIETAKIYVACRDPRKANLAILDFSALICTPKNPKHQVCPLRKECRYVVQHQDGNSQLTPSHS